MKKYNTRYATSEDFKKYYPDCPYSFKGWVIEDDKDILVIGGLLLDYNYKTMILNVIKAPPKKMLFTAAKMVVEECKKISSIFYTFRDVNIKNSDKFLEKLGFRKMNHSEEHYIWQE